MKEITNGGLRLIMGIGGSKLHRSDDEGKSWKEVDPPKYPEGTMVNEQDNASLKYIWAIASGGDNKPNTIYIGTEPGGLFKSDDNGESFELVRVYGIILPGKNSGLAVAVIFLEYIQLSLIRKIQITFMQE